MKCQSLLFGKNKKNIITLLSVEFVQRVVKVTDSPNQTVWLGKDLKCQILFPLFRFTCPIANGLYNLFNTDLELRNYVLYF